jgi:hypothetical protein
MKLQSFQQMLLEYGITGLESDDKSSRDEMLLLHPHSVILEGGYLELDTLNQWLEVNLGHDSIKWLFYGKTGYDYGFAEYFFTNELDAHKVSRVIPNVYTVYPDSYPPNEISKSNGYDEHIMYDPADKDAIIFGPLQEGK